MVAGDDTSLRDLSGRWLQWFGGRRIVAAVFTVPGVVLLAWWLLRVPPVPVESTLPFSDAVVLPVPATAPIPIPGAAPGSDAEASSSIVAQPVIHVHVVGAVVAPGVYALPLGSRGDDAVQAAGGALASADLARINLAAPLTDAVQLYVPRRGESHRPAATIAPGASRVGRSTIDTAVTHVAPSDADLPAASPSPVANGRVRLNVAGVQELDSLPGVGPATAAAIVDHRRRNGPFRSLDDLDAVNGIGPARIAALRDLVVVD